MLKTPLKVTFIHTVSIPWDSLGEGLQGEYRKTQVNNMYNISEHFIRALSPPGNQPIRGPLVRKGGVDVDTLDFVRAVLVCSK